MRPVGSNNFAILYFRRITMAIPKNITREHLLQAINKIDQEGITPDAESRYYDLVHNDKRYPPKLVVSLANLFANGTILDRNDFQGGPGKPAFQLLEARGFTIKPKDRSILPLLLDFLDRSNNDPNNLTTSEFPKEFQDLKLKLSFGQGVQAATPWIALLGENQSVSDGIYPVYLYYKQHKLLILSYGVSETNKPEFAWQVENETIRQYFKRHVGAEPNRYGDSLVYKVYDIDPAKDQFGLKQDSVDQDIINLMREYKIALGTQPVSQAQTSILPNDPSMDFDASAFIADLASAHLLFNETTVYRFIACLATKPFVILTGLSGSGKTKLALSFARWIIRDDTQLCIVPVGADWTNREPLLGFPNMQKSETYEMPETKVLSLILSARTNPGLPYFLILDEMNLSHVERYFADFLSSMESGEGIGLHPGEGDWNNGQIPNSIELPKNLFIIGTVNVDETTYMFSPKVLDRASVIEFRVTANEMRAFLQMDKSRPASGINGQGSDMAASFLKICQSSMKRSPAEEHAQILLDLFTNLKKAGAEFGYRTAEEINRFITVAPTIHEWDDDSIFDFVIVQKLLPKVHGSRRKLEPILKTLAGLCLTSEANVVELLKVEVDETDEPHVSQIKYPMSFDKIKRMYQNLIDNSFTSYAEA